MRTNVESLRGLNSGIRQYSGDADSMGVFGLQPNRWMILFIIVFILMYLYALFQYNETILPHPSSPPISTCDHCSVPCNMSFINNTVDEMTLVDLTDFKFITNSQRCNGVKNLFIIVFVHSAPQNFRKREIIRATWGSEKNLAGNIMRLVFLIGKTHDPHLSLAIAVENLTHNDIVQGNFIDSYRNLTYKHVMGLKWITYFCRHAKYVLKADDDIFVDIFQLTNHLKSTFGLSPPDSFIMCLLIKNTFVRRSQRSKWRVTFKEYKDGYYPTYCAGWAIIMSSDVACRLYLQSSLVPYFWIDDVHVSGTLAKRIGLTHLDFSRNLYLGDSDLKKWLHNKNLIPPHMFGQPIFDVNIIHQLWNKTLQYYTLAHSKT